MELSADEEEDSKPAAKPTATKKKTPKQKARSKKAQDLKEEASDLLADQLATMSLQTKTHDMSITCPCIMHQCTDCGRKIVSVDFLAPNQHRRFFRLKVVDKKVLELVIIIPKTFCDPSRILAANQANKKFHKNTSKATAFANKCKEIEKAGTVARLDHDTGEEEIEVSTGGQRVQLPFTAEEDLCRGKKGKGDGYTVFAAENDDDVLFAELEEPTDLFILSVDLVSDEKEKKKPAPGAMAKLKSPTKLCDDVSSSEDDKDDMDEGEGES